MFLAALFELSIYCIIQLLISAALLIVLASLMSAPFIAIFVVVWVFEGIKARLKLFPFPLLPQPRSLSSLWSIAILIMLVVGPGAVTLVGLADFVLGGLYLIAGGLIVITLLVGLSVVLWGVESTEMCLKRFWYSRRRNKPRQEPNRKGKPKPKPKRKNDWLHR